MYNTYHLMKPHFATRTTVMLVLGNHICSPIKINKKDFSALIVHSYNKKLYSNHLFFKRSFTNINEFIRINYKQLNEDVYLQGLALGFWESRYTLLEYKQKNMIYNKLSLAATLRLSKNIHVSAEKILKQLEELKPCNQTSDLFKKQLLKKYKKLLKMTLEDVIHD